MKETTVSSGWRYSPLKTNLRVWEAIGVKSLEISDYGNEWEAVYIGNDGLQDLVDFIYENWGIKNGSN